MSTPGSKAEYRMQVAVDLTRERDQLRAELEEVKAENERLRTERNIAVNTAQARTPDFDVMALRIATEQRGAAEAERDRLAVELAEVKATHHATLVRETTLAAQVAAVRALHKPNDKPDEVYYAHCSECPPDEDGDRECVGHMVICCAHCEQGTDPDYGDNFACPVPYPCPTARALDGTGQDEAVEQ